MCRPAFTTNKECGDNHVQRGTFKLRVGVLVSRLSRVLAGKMFDYPADSIVLLWVLCDSCIGTDLDGNGFFLKSVASSITEKELELVYFEAYGFRFCWLMSCPRLILPPTSSWRKHFASQVSRPLPGACLHSALARIHISP